MLVRWLQWLALAALLFGGPSVFAQTTDAHNYSWEALEHCEEHGQSGLSSTEYWHVEFKVCTQQGYSFREDCDMWQNPSTTNTFYGTTNCSWARQQLGNPGTVAWHNFTTFADKPECNDPIDNYLMSDGEGGYECVPHPCDGGMFGIEEPDQDTIDSINQHGYVCSPESMGNCVVRYVGQSEDGLHLFQEDLEGAQCGPGDDDIDRPWDETAEEGGPDPDGPNDPNDPDPPASDPCGSANPYDLFCLGDPSEDCPGGVCSPGCGYFNGYFICQNPDNPNQDCFNVLNCNNVQPDGDATGDGEVNIDLRPTNQLLQEIRNSLNDGSEPPETTEGLAELFDQWQEENPMSEEGFLTELDILGLGMGEGGIFGHLESDADDVASSGAWGQAGGSCPSLEWELPYGAVALADTSEVVGGLQVIFNFIVWTLIGAYSWFIFTHKVFEK